MKSATRSFSSRMSAGSSGTSTRSSLVILTVRSGLAWSLRHDASRGERALEHGLLERARPATVAGLLDAQAAGCECGGETVLGHASQREDEQVCVEGRLSLWREDVAEPDGVVCGVDELEVVRDRDAGAVETLEVEVPAVLMDSLADRDRGDRERHDVV